MTILAFVKFSFPKQVEVHLTEKEVLGVSLLSSFVDGEQENWQPTKPVANWDERDFTRVSWDSPDNI